MEEKETASGQEVQQKKKSRLIPAIIIAACVILLVVTFIGVKISKKNKQDGFAGMNIRGILADGKHNFLLRSFILILLINVIP